MPGYSTLIVATRDARRVLSVSLTPTSNRDGSENDYLLRIAAAAFGIDIDDAVQADRERCM